MSRVAVGYGKRRMRGEDKADEEGASDDIKEVVVKQLDAVNISPNPKP